VYRRMQTWFQAAKLSDALLWKERQAARRGGKALAA
jgi:hypothetical protein